MTAGMKLQSVIVRALDNNKYVLMSSLDLSSAFDIVNVRLLIKKLRIIGLPDDIISLANEWLTYRYFYVNVVGENSYIHGIGVGTVQGSILGPILNAMFIIPLFDLTKMTLFAYGNHVLRRHKQKTSSLARNEDHTGNKHQMAENIRLKCLRHKD